MLSSTPPERGERRSLRMTSRTGRQAVFARLTDEEVTILRDRLRPIELENEFEMRVAGADGRLALPRAFMGAEHYFGRSSVLFDDYKGSFRFPLLLALSGDFSHRFVMVVEDYRCSIMAQLFRLEAGEEQGDRDADLEGAERDELKFFGSFLVGQLILIGSFNPGGRTFHRVVESQHVVYGACGGDGFERGARSPEGFARLVDEIKREQASVEASRLAEAQRALLDDIEQGVHRQM